ncbi:MAG: oxygenase MpaB family protein [Acidimicrobiia bacterium]
MPGSTSRLWLPPRPSPPELAAGAAAGAAARLAAPLLAGFAREAMGHLVDTNGTHRERYLNPEADTGWFGPGSVTWRVHADIAMLVAGLGAFALQSLHPRALAGVVDHSSFGDDFFGRTKRTGAYILAVTYGTSAEATKAVRTVQKIHQRVIGVTPDGRPYQASEPELLHWVHVTQYAATAAAHQRFAAHPLGHAELDRYIAEVARVGEAMEVADPPRSWAELDAALQHHRPHLAVGEQAREALRFLADPPGLALALKPVWRVLFAGGMASLPPFARRLIGVRSPTMPEVAACRALVRATGALLDEPVSLARARAHLEAMLRAA